MMRNLVIWMLVAPLLVNGVWLVCADGPSEVVRASENSDDALLEEAAKCAMICAAKHMLNGGEMCLILPGDAKASIRVIDFGAAIVPYNVVQLQRVTTSEQFVAELHFFYSNPSTPYPTPPPRA